MVRGLFETTNGLEVWLREAGEPEFRAKQLADWVVRRRAIEFSQMTNLPAGLRQRLADEWTVFTSSVRHVQESDDRTRKLLLTLADNKTVEAVLLFQENRRTVCLSTQVGCAMGCVFCASGLNGVERNLTTCEMIEELVLARNLLSDEERITHIVVMGMGEPLANLPALLPALEFATSKTGLGLSARHVTISTVGLPAKIGQLAETGRPYHLAVSLHAPNDELRQQIVPMAEKIALADLLSAADDYRDRTGRQVTFEYVLLAGVNDEIEHARQLCRLLKGRDAMINLIPYNPVAGLPYRTPNPDRVRAFARQLRDYGFPVKIRKRKGDDINAACGQLRRMIRL